MKPKPWREAMRDALVSGCLASLTSTAVLAVFGWRENRSPHAPLNATSQWIWGEGAAWRDDPSAGHTLVGYTIHHASVTFWALLYERWFGRTADRGEVFPASAGAAIVAALACLADYNATPRRLHPGFEKRLSRTALFLVYVATGAALPLRGLVVQTARPRT